MDEQTPTRQGVIDGCNRVCRELLRSPNVRQSLRILLRELDPENAPALVRTLLRTDPELTLGLLSALPGMGNAALLGMREAMLLLANYPPALLASFLAQMAAELDAEALGETAGLLLAVVVKAAQQDIGGLSKNTEGLKSGIATGFHNALSQNGLEPYSVPGTLADAAVSAIQSFAAHLNEQAQKDESGTAAAVDKLAAGIREAAKQNPIFVQKVLRPLFLAGQEACADASFTEDSTESDDDA